LESEKEKAGFKDSKIGELEEEIKGKMEKIRVFKGK